MSLSPEQMRKTSVELQENYYICELTAETICQELHIDSGELAAVLAMKNPDPTTVWRVRDYMEKKIKEQGKQPAPYSSLKVNIWYRY